MTECKYSHLLFGELVDFPIAGVTCAKCPMPSYIGLDTIPVTYRGHMNDGGTQRFDAFAIDPSHRGHCPCGEPREFIFDSCGGDGGIADALFKDILAAVDAEVEVERG